MSKIDRVHFRRNEDGLYLDAFEDKENAKKYIEEMVRKYRYSPTKPNAKELCEEAQEEGVMVYPKFFRGVLDTFNVTIRPQGRPKTDTQSVLLYLSEAALDYLQPLADMRLMSWYVDRIIRVQLGLVIEELLVYIDDELRENVVSVLICQPKGDEWTGLYFGRVSQHTKRQIEEWCYDVEENGLDYLERKLKVNGHFVVGNNKE